MKLVRLDLGLLTCHFPIFEGYVCSRRRRKLVVVVVAVAIAGIVGG